MPRFLRILGQAGRANARPNLPFADGINNPIGRRALSLFVGLVLVAAGMVLNVGAHSTVASATTPVTYYVAMGDSLASGVGATQPANDYVNLLYQHELTRYPGLQLVNLSCSGATTTNVLSGGGGCSYLTGTQLGDAEAFLRAHRGQIAFLTIDIGFDNVLPCMKTSLGSILVQPPGSEIDGTCVQDAMSVVSTELPQILGGLQSASPGLSIYGMDYYDGFLAGWLLGGSGVTLAQQSATYVVSFNTLLGQIYGAAGASMADPAGPFQTTDFALTGSYLGMTVPQNVALICEWTLICVQHYDNIHTNDVGYAELADSFEQVIDPGYWEVASDGGVFSFGSAQFYGSMGGKPLNAPIVGLAAAPGGNGYWEVASDGEVTSFGSAQFYGSMGGKPLNAPIVGMAAAPGGNGYWEVASDGGVFSFGSAQFYGSMGGKPLNAPIVGLAAAPGGNGYWEVASDGEVFSFGSAQFYGSMGGKPLNAPIVGMAAAPGGNGYWEVASDGGVFSFGSAQFYGSMGGKPLNAPIVGLAAAPGGNGYWEVASDGEVFSFGSAQFYGSMGGKPLSAPIVGLA
jgi:lysophospholipase L1-like esterase/ribosomal protein L24E